MPKTQVNISQFKSIYSTREIKGVLHVQFLTKKGSIFPNKNMFLNQSQLDQETFDLALKFHINN